MTLPNQPSLELPLLLELERAGGAARPRLEFYNKVVAHFPDVQPADRELVRRNGRTKVWENTVDWARNSLRAQGQMYGGKGDGWQITPDGKTRLRKDLLSLGLPPADVEGFVAGRDTIAGRLGHQWRPRQLALRRASRSREITVQGPPPEPLPETKAKPALRPYEAPVGDIRAQVLSRLRALDDAQFERFCGRLMEALGFEHVEITGRSHDRGIDGHATLKHLRLRIAFQAKNWRNNPVGAPRVREFRGSIVNRFPLGVCVTTSSFTTGAEEEANEPGPPKMVLVDGDKLVEIMLERGLGVHTVPVTKQEISEDFFASI